MTTGKSSSGTIFVILLIGAGLLGAAGTWWNYSHIHPSTTEARLSRLDPPTVTATFRRALPFHSYVATVTLRGTNEKYEGHTGNWKRLADGSNTTEILLKQKPQGALQTPCAVTLDLEEQSP